MQGNLHGFDGFFLGVRVGFDHPTLFEEMIQVILLFFVDLGANDFKLLHDAVFDQAFDLVKMLEEIRDIFGVQHLNKGAAVRGKHSDAFALVQMVNFKDPGFDLEILYDQMT